MMLQNNEEREMYQSILRKCLSAVRSYKSQDTEEKRKGNQNSRKQR